MSRNLGSLNCYFCSSRVSLVGTKHEITAKEARIYYNEYRGMIVADAECDLCKAEYLAWVSKVPHGNYKPESEWMFSDLSFRSSFNDEPNLSDMPKNRNVVNMNHDLLKLWDDSNKRLEEHRIVNHPPHYQVVPNVECIQVVEHFNFNRGNAIKYIWRAGSKGNEIEDLEKALWYLTREIKNLKEKGSTP